MYVLSFSVIIVAIIFTMTSCQAEKKELEVFDKFVQALGNPDMKLSARSGTSMEKINQVMEWTGFKFPKSYVEFMKRWNGCEFIGEISEIQNVRRSEHNELCVNYNLWGLNRHVLEEEPWDEDVVYFGGDNGETKYAFFPNRPTFGDEVEIWVDDFDPGTTTGCVAYSFPEFINEFLLGPRKVLIYGRWYDSWGEIPDEAIELLKRAGSMDRSFLYNLPKLYLQLNRHTEAIEALKKALVDAPYTALWLGDAMMNVKDEFYIKFRDNPEVMLFLRQRLENMIETTDNPEDKARAYYLLANIYAMIDDKPKSLEMLRKAFELHKNIADDFIKILYSSEDVQFSGMDDYEFKASALSVCADGLNKLANQTPNDADVYYHLGRMHILMDVRGKIFETFTKSLSLEPKCAYRFARPAIWVDETLSSATTLAGWRKFVIDDCLLAIEKIIHETEEQERIHPSMARSYEHRAYIYMLKDNEEEVLESLRQILYVSPHYVANVVNAMSVDKSGWWWADSSLDTGAIIDWQTARKLIPECIEVLEWMAEAPDASWMKLYYLARVNAVANNHLGVIDSLKEVFLLNPNRDEVIRRCKADSLFDNIRDTKEFQELLGQDYY